MGIPTLPNYSMPQFLAIMKLSPTHQLILPTLFWSHSCTWGGGIMEMLIMDMLMTLMTPKFSYNSKCSIFEIFMHPRTLIGGNPTSTT